MRPIAIVGMGAVSPFGCGSRVLWEGCMAGVTWERPVRGFDAHGMRHRHGVLLEPDAMREAPVLAMASMAVMEALGSCAAEHELPAEAATRLGIWLATAPGEPDELRVVNEHEAGRSNPEAVAELRTLPAPAAAAVLGDSISAGLLARHGWGEAACATVSAACASANVALIQAADALADGWIDRAIVVSADTLTRLTQAGFTQVGALSPTTPRPFCAERAGTLVGEGASALVLERADSVAPSARVLAWLLGTGQSCDALHPVHTEARGRGIELATRRALADAGVEASQVDAIYVHGTGTRQNDLSEARALAQVFEGTAVPAAAIKAVAGHALCAASGLAAVTAVMTLRTGWLPPTAGVSPMDPECQLAFSTEPRQLPAPRYVLNNGYGFGGINSSVLLARHRPELAGGSPCSS